MFVNMVAVCELLHEGVGNFNNANVSKISKSGSQLWSLHKIAQLPSDCVDNLAAKCYYVYVHFMTKLLYASITTMVQLSDRGEFSWKRRK